MKIFSCEQTAKEKLFLFISQILGLNEGEIYLLIHLSVSKVFEEEETLLAQTVEGSIPWMVSYVVFTSHL